MVNGFQIDYKTKRGFSTKFSHTLFGRISSRRKGEKYFAYYLPGILDNIQFYKIYDGRIFVGSIIGVDFNSVLQYCESWKVTAAEKTDEDVHMRTANQYWKFRAKERGLKIDGF